MATRGNFTTTSCEGRSLTFSWSLQSQSIENNTSTISWRLYGSGSYSGYVMGGPFTVVVNGSIVHSSSNRIQVWAGNTQTTTVASGTTTISHNSDGTKSFSASASAAIYSYSVNCSGSGSWDLTTIPRASSITSVANVTLGNKCGITFTPASTSFQYDIRFSLGSWAVSTGKFTPGTTSAYTYNYYTIPNNSSLLSQIPSSTTGTMTATLTTYDSNDTQIGSTSSKTFTVTVPSSVKPTIAASNITLTPQTYSYLIQNKNKLKIEVSGCSEGTGSSIKSYTFSGPGVSTTTTSTSVTTSVISDTGTLTYTVTVTDNRGRTASATKTYICYAYSAPKITLSAYRVASSSSTTANNDGSYVRCTYNLSYASVGNNTPTIKIYYKKSTATTWASTSASVSSTTSGTSGTINGIGSYTLSGISSNSTYSVYATITDSYGGNTSSLTVTIFGAERILNIRSDGKSIGFGKMADEKNSFLDSKWAIRSDDPAGTMNNLTFRGANLISSTANDTTANWVSQGNLATTYYNKLNQLNGQPGLYGFVVNVTNNAQQVHQLWMSQELTTDGKDIRHMYHRGGNKNGFGDWRMILDSTNYTNYASSKPVTLYSGVTNGTISTLSQSAANFNYLEIYYMDDYSNGRSCVRVYKPDGKTVDLSVIEASASTQTTYIRRTRYTISGTTITPNVTNSGYVHINGTTILGTYTGTNKIKIYLVLGYK